MNNKFKKFLATIGLGVVGCASLAGCSLTGDQQANVNELLDRADNLTTKLEEVLDNQNKTYTKKDILDKITLTSLNFTMNAYNNLHIVIKGNGFEGYFEDSQEIDLPVAMNGYFRYKDNIRLGAFYNDELTYFVKEDFSNDIAYTFRREDVEDSESESELFEEINKNDVAFGGPMSQFNPFPQAWSYSEEDIYDITVDANKLNFKIIESQLDEESKTYFISIMDYEYTGDYLTYIKGSSLTFNYEETDFVKDEDGEIVYRNNVPDAQDNRKIKLRSTISEGYYEYENINFEAIDAKVLEIEEKYLNKN